MKNTIGISTLFILLNFQVLAQFDTSQVCNININNPIFLNQLRKPVVDATFNWSGCTGVLINRNTNDGQIGYYFLTARHCVSADNGDANAPSIDFDKNYTLKFNFQSPDAFNNSTQISNRGLFSLQSNNYPNVVNGFEYFHTTKLRLVNRFFWGDFALVEILTPLPPHFNYTYAGWNANRFFYGMPLGANLPPIIPSPYVGISHPRRDIKKIAGAHSIEWLESPIAASCYTITTVIDVLFGWLWGNKTSTRVICNYVDNPWVIVRNWDYGAVEEGSSGSGLFGPDNRQFGILSGVGGSCNFPAVIAYGKFHANFFNKSIKNTLNPANDVLVDLLGMPSRKIECYPSLRLPGPIIPGDPNSLDVSGQYFPANHYQANNNITLSAVNDILTEQDINIYPDANYTFRAGKSITLNQGFFARPGSVFKAEIGSCITFGKTDEENESLNKMISKMRETSQLIASKQYSNSNSEEYKVSPKSLISIFPNPTNGSVQVIFNTNKESAGKYIISDVLGKRIYENDIHFVIGYNSIVINKFEEFNNGTYILSIMIGDVVHNEKVVKF